MSPHIDPAEAGEPSSGNILKDLGFTVREPVGSFMDGNRVTPGTAKCVCGPDCEFPCWQRIGVTDQACCPGCPPLGGAA